MRSYPVPQELQETVGTDRVSRSFLTSLADHPQAGVQSWADRALTSETQRPLVASGCDPELEYYGVMDPELEEPVIISVVSLSPDGSLRRWNGSGWDSVEPDFHPVGYPFAALDDELLADALGAVTAGGLLLRPTNPRACYKRGAITSAAASTAGYYAIVDDFDSTAVLDLLRVDAGPAVYVRRGGTWERDAAALARLRSVDPPTVVRVNGEDLESVTEQVDQFDQEATTASGWLPRCEPAPDSIEERRRASARERITGLWRGGDAVAASAAIEHEKRTRAAFGNRLAAWDSELAAAELESHIEAVTAASQQGGGAGSSKRRRESSGSSSSWDESKVNRDKDPGEQGRFAKKDDSGSETATTESGDTLESLARKYGTTVEALRRMNPNLKPGAIPAGMSVQVPRGSQDRTAPAPKFAPVKAPEKKGSGGGGGGGGASGASAAKKAAAAAKRADAAKKTAARKKLAAAKRAAAAKKRAAAAKAKAAADRKKKALARAKAAAAAKDSEFDLEQAKQDAAETTRRKAESDALRAASAELEERARSGENVGGEAAALRAKVDAERKRRAEYDAAAQARAQAEKIRRMEVRIRLQKATAALTAAAPPERSMMPDKLKGYWVRGVGAAKIRWGTGGDFNRCRRALAKYLRPDQIGGACANLHKAATGTWPGKGRSHGVAASGAPTHAGVAMVARDTGRVLLLQRSYYDEDDPARGTWEFPGGGIEDEESPHEAARREWCEETGCEFPESAEDIGTWDSYDGVYRGHIVVVPTEQEVNINSESGRVINPDDPDGDNIEVSAWYDLEHLPTNPSLRQEVKNTNWAALRVARDAAVR